MSLENIFYVVGIISMGLNILLLIAIALILFYIKQKVTDAYNKVEDKIDFVKEAVSNPRGMAASAGAAFADTAFTKASSFMNSRKSKSKSKRR